MDTTHEFTLRLKDLLRREHLALVDFLLALAEYDRQRLWIQRGHASLFYFLHRELGLSKGAAFYRKTAAELVQRFPEIVEPLREGKLCLTSVVELAKVLTPENRAEVLPRFFQLSKREAKEVSAEVRPLDVPPRREVVTVPRHSANGAAFALAAPAQPDLAQVVHPANQLVPARQLVQAAYVDPPRDAPRASGSGSPIEPARSDPAPALVPHPTPPRLPRTTTEPLTGDLSRLHVTVSRGFLKKLEAARAALSHSHPGAGTEEILEAGLDLVLERHAKRKGLVEKPRAEPRPSGPGHVPAHVVREVWKRDGGRCQWRLASGGSCGSTLRVEVDHRIAKARGGPATVENLRCLCRVHNDLAAREVFGNEWMDRYTAGRRDDPPRRVSRPRARTTFDGSALVPT